ISANQLARLLREFGITPRNIRISAKATPKGYYLDDFSDPFSRYLPGNVTLKRHNATTPVSIEGNPLLASATLPPCGAPENATATIDDARCGVVADGELGDTDGNDKPGRRPDAEYV